MSETETQPSRRRYRVAAAVTAIVSVLALWSGTSSAFRHDSTLVSRAAGSAGVKGDGPSASPGISDDGRYVTFASQASNLDPDDGDATSDVYLRDLTTGVVSLVSRATGPTGAKGDADSSALLSGPSVSGDGSHVGFYSGASNLAADDGDATTDVFVRDLKSEETTLISRASGPTGAKGNDISAEPRVSTDGRYVTFWSTASNLHPDDGDATTDVFVRDLQTDVTTLVSRATGSAGPGGDGDSSGVLSGPSISGDGGVVAFNSLASNLATGDADAVGDVFVRDLPASTTMLVSRASGVVGVKGDGGSFYPALSADGHHVAFVSSATNLDPSDPDATLDVFVRGLQTSTTTLVSRASGVDGAKGNGDAFYPTVSADGRYVTFLSAASNLDPADRDDAIDVFVRDLQAATTTLVSRAAGPSGMKANGLSFAAAVSGDGAYVAFDSTAANIDPADGDTASDIFVRQILGSDAPPPLPGVTPGAPGVPTPTPPPVLAGPPGTSSPDRIAPRLKVSGRLTQTLGKALEVGLLCPDESCRVTARGSLLVPRVDGVPARTYRLRPAVISIAAGRSLTVELRVWRTARAAAERAIRRGKRVVAAITLETTDAAGNARTVPRVVKLRAIRTGARRRSAARPRRATSERGARS